MALDTTKNYKQVTIVMPQKVTPNYFANLAQKAVPAATDEVLLIDNAAGGAAKRALVPAVAQQNLNGVNVPKSAGTAVFAMSAAGVGNTFNLANNATLNLAGSTAFVGLVLITNDTSGGTALLLVNFFACIVISNPDNIFSVASGTASKTNVYKAGLGQPVVVENKTGSSMQYSAMVFRLS